MGVDCSYLENNSQKGMALAWLRRVYSFNQHNRDQWVASQAARIPNGQRILDAGAGVGRYRHLFRHCEYRTHDFGQEPGTIGHYTTLDYMSDITAIPVPDQSFDVILCTEVLEHVPEPIKALREFARILRPRGYLLLTAPLGSRLHQEPYHFYGGYTPHWYRKFLSEAGFAIESIESNQGFFSHFGQEAVHYSTLIDPRRTLNLGWPRWALVTLLWLVTLPLLRVLFSLVGGLLDRLGLEYGDTVGYHVVALRSVK
jgi:SAM-dependent methyltransferase